MQIAHTRRTLSLADCRRRDERNVQLRCLGIGDATEQQRSFDYGQFCGYGTNHQPVFGKFCNNRLAFAGRSALAERLCNRLHSGTCTAHRQLWTCYRTSSRRYSSAHYKLALGRPQRLRSSRDSLLLWSGQPQHW